MTLRKSLLNPLPCHARSGLLLTGLLLAGGGALLPSLPAEATVMSFGNLETRRDVDFGVGPATLDILVHTSDPNSGTTNDLTLDTGLGGAAALVPGASIDFPNLGLSFSPVVGFVGGPAVASRTVRSDSPSVAPVASAVAGFTPPTSKGTAFVSTSISRLPHLPPRAAGIVRDPYQVEADDYIYNPLINEIQLESTRDRGLALLSLGGADSSTGSLWQLDIIAPAFFDSTADLSINFVSDPSLGLVDALVAENLRNAFTIVGVGMASLAGHTLFSTTYSPTTTVIFEEFIQAASTVPAPPVALLLGLGLAGLMLTRRDGG